MTSIFPTITDRAYEETSAPERKDTKTCVFDFAAGDFVLEDRRPKMVSGIERIKAWIEKLVRTEADAFAVYNLGEGTYGVEFLQWFYGSRDREYIRAELSREIREKMLESPEITDVRDLTVTVDRHACTVAYSVQTIYGETEGSFNVQ